MVSDLAILAQKWFKIAVRKQFVWQFYTLQQMCVWKSITYEGFPALRKMYAGMPYFWFEQDEVIDIPKPQCLKV